MDLVLYELNTAGKYFQIKRIGKAKLNIMKYAYWDSNSI